MKIARLRWNSDMGWHGDADLPEANLVLVFGDHDHFHSHACYAELQRRFPKAHIAGCSSSGNVAGTTITDCDVVATAIQLEHGTARLVSGKIEPGADLKSMAAQLMQRLQSTDLRHVLVLSEGLHANGSEIALGLDVGGTTVTGGLAGDAMRLDPRG
jgi:hypothetical protein